MNDEVRFLLRVEAMAEFLAVLRIDPELRHIVEEVQEDVEGRLCAAKEEERNKSLSEPARCR